MHRIAHLLALLGVGIGFLGCGPNKAPSEAVKKSTIGPHGAMALTLDGDKGYVEVLLERPKSRAARKAAQPMLVAYFLQKDGKTALTPLPTAVDASVRPPGKDAPLSLALVSRPVGSDPASAGRFASEPGDLDYDDLPGELSATLDGQTVKVSFTVR
jgi:hypothetical protein